MITKAKLNRLKKLFGFQDWDITVVEDISIEACGECYIRDPFCEAIIKINPELISDASEFGFSDTLDITLYHEFGELVMAQMLPMLPEEIRDSEQFEVYRDFVADRIGKIARKTQ